MMGAAQGQPSSDLYRVDLLGPSLKTSRCDDPLFRLFATPTTQYETDARARTVCFIHRAIRRVLYI
jgi:hypothetical protein